MWFNSVGIYIVTEKMDFLSQMHPNAFSYVACIFAFSQKDTIRVLSHLDRLENISPLAQFIWTSVNTAITLWNRRGQPGWDHLKGLVSTRFHLNPGAICLQWHSNWNTCPWYVLPGSLGSLAILLHNSNVKWILTCKMLILWGLFLVFLCFEHPWVAQKSFF